jgi:hypothetical protein
MTTPETSFERHDVRFHTYAAGHFDIYAGEAFETVIRDRLALLRRVVPVAPEPSVEVRDLTA